MGRPYVPTFLMLFCYLGVFAVSCSMQTQTGPKGFHGSRLLREARASAEIISKGLSKTPYNRREYADGSALAGIILMPGAIHNTTHSTVKQLPYGTVLEQFKVEPIGPASTYLAAGKQHDSTEHLLVEIHYVPEAVNQLGSITKWKQYQNHLNTSRLICGTSRNNKGQPSDYVLKG